MHPRQVRIEGAVPLDVARAIGNAHVCDEPLMVGLRDVNGDQLLHCPVRFVLFESSPGHSSLTLHVEAVGMVQLPRELARAESIAANGHSVEVPRNIDSPRVDRRDLILERNARIRKLADEGMSVRELAVRNELSTTHIRNIIKGRF